jgi:hypothetical protein
MAPDRALSSHSITRSSTAHRVLRSELNDYDLKFKVSLPTLPPPKTRLPPGRQPTPAPRTPRRAYRRSGTIEVWWETSREVMKEIPDG